MDDDNDKIENSTGFTSDDRVLEKLGYTVSRVLGEGAFGKVFLANYTSKTGTQIKLACKLIDGQKAHEKFMLKHLPREINIMRRLDHPAIIKIHSVIERGHHNRILIFMQFAENGDLMDFMIANGTITEKQARVWFSQIILGMGFMHGLNIAHRDIKCENIFLNESYNVKIADMGFSRHWRKGREEYSETYCGSLSYIAPEILKCVPYDPLKADLWSMAVVLYVMVNKTLPFDSQHMHMADIYKKQMAREWRFTSKPERTLSVTGKEFINILLEPDPDLRLSTGAMWRHPWIQNGIKTETTLDYSRYSHIHTGH